MSSRRARVFDDQLVIPGFGIPAADESVEAPTAVASENTDRVLGENEDPAAAQAIIQFIESGFPKEMWETTSLSSWFHNHVFGVDWPPGRDDYYKRWFSSPGYQFEWLKKVLQTRHYRIPADQIWTETDKRVRIEISTRLYKKLADADAKWWTPPRQTIGAPEPTRTQPSYYRTFRSTDGDTADHKIKTATAIVKFIEGGFRWEDFTPAVSKSLDGLGLPAHYNRRGTYDVNFGDPEGPARWLAHVTRDWERARGNWGGNWSDVQAALHEIIVDRGYEAVFRERAVQQRRQDAEAALAALIEAMPDVARKLVGQPEPAITPITADRFRGNSRHESHADLV